MHRNGAIIRELARRGHNITVISPDIDKNPTPGVHFILIENQYTEENREFVKQMMTSTERENPLLQAFHLFQLSVEFCQSISGINIKIYNF